MNSTEVLNFLFFVFQEIMVLIYLNEKIQESEQWKRKHATDPLMRESFLRNIAIREHCKLSLWARRAAHSRVGTRNFRTGSCVLKSASVLVAAGWESWLVKLPKFSEIQFYMKNAQLFPLNKGIKALFFVVFLIRGLEGV